jgi:hypothetical protein
LVAVGLPPALPVAVNAREIANIAVEYFMLALRLVSLLCAWKSDERPQKPL